jgi:hypothetical protein
MGCAGKRYFKKNDLYGIIKDYPSTKSAEEQGKESELRAAFADFLSGVLVRISLSRLPCPFLDMCILCPPTLLSSGRLVLRFDSGDQCT